MKHSRLLLLLILPVISSCSRHFYTPALYNNDISYQAKPASFDSTKSATYVSAGFGANESVSSSNTISFGELNISEGHVLGPVNIAYGAFGYAGAIDNSNYDNETDDPHRFKTKGFAGVGGRFSLNMFKNLGNADFRYLGFEAAYNKEYGDFAAYRSEVSNLPGYSATTRTEVVTVGGTTEILWHAAMATDQQYAFRLFIGKTLGNYSYLDNSDANKVFQKNAVYIAASYFMQVNHFFGVAEFTRSVEPVTGFRLKLGYRF